MLCNLLMSMLLFIFLSALVKDAISIKEILNQLY